MRHTISEAIRSMNRLSFTYDGYQRVVEPHAIGVSSKGNDVMRCYQVRGSGSDGKSTGWHLMTVSKIAGLQTLQEAFAKPRPEYKRGDRNMTTIYCEL